jgi:hypothetical protein
MAQDDSGDLILARLDAIGETLTVFKTRASNEVEIGGGDIYPGFNILDGDEDGDGDINARAPLRATPMTMRPLICLADQAPASEIRGKLRAHRRAWIKAVLGDAQLKELCGTTGGMAYRGYVTQFGAGEQVIGKMTLSFEFQYLLAPAHL